MDSGLTADERRELAGRARTLHERIQGPPNDPGGEAAIDPGRVVEEWRAAFPDDAAFADRLDREALTEAAVREHVAATRWPADEPLPGWVDEVDALVRHVEAVPPGERRDTSLSDDVAFVELLDAIADYARTKLPDGTVPEGADSRLVAGLGSRLQMVTVRALYVEFKSFVGHHDPALLDADPGAFEELPTALYDRFVDAMFERGFHNLCIEYPVLARHLVRLVEFWVESTVELCRRVRADLPALRDRFGVDGEPTGFEPLTDDTHARGRVPVRVPFEEGAVIYKPRPVDAGVVFYTILERLDEHLPTPSFRVPTYLPRDDYGWMAVVEYREPADEAAAERYYERAGALVCVAYACNTNDLQLENLIVDGEQPMVVDGETLFHPSVVPSVAPYPEAIYGVLDRLVLLTSLLPWSAGDPREADTEGLAAIVAGLGSESGKTNLSDRTFPRVEYVNTDVMTVGPKEPEFDRSSNTPSVDGEDHTPRMHIDAICRGFERAHETLRALRDDGRLRPAVLDPDLLGEVENRFIYRATGTYVSVLRDAVARNPLRDGAMFTVEMEELAVPFFDGRIESDRHWELYETERRALRRLDVPRLTSRPTESTVYHDGDPLDVSADEPGFDRARRRIDSMDGADLDRQRWVLRHSFGVPPAPTAPPPRVETTDDRLERAALDLLDCGLDASFAVEGDENWVSISPGSRTFTLVPADHTLYHGRSGLAVAAAAAYHLTGRERYRRRIDDLLAPLSDALDGDDPWFGLGGTMGSGSVVYTLSVLAELLDEDAYREHARTVALSVAEGRLAQDEVFDVMEGAAGTLLGLLGYHDRFGDPAVLDRAVACGERLLDARTEVDGFRVWTGADASAPAQTGFAHGTTGIAYALARLAAVTDDPRCEAASREALDFEASLYSPERDNWPTARGSGRYHDRWCHGRSGMALGRIGIAEALGDDSLLAEASAALATTAAGDPSPGDHVCCGNLGRVEALLVGARRGDGSVEVADARALAGRCLARREREGSLSLPGHCEAFVNPTFFDGVAGAAYTLLRLRDPDAVPCVVAFE